MSNESAAKQKLIDLRHRIINEGYTPTLEEQREAVNLLRQVRVEALENKGKRGAKAKAAAEPLDLAALFSPPTKKEGE
jgi:hypothetical protein